MPAYPCNIDDVYFPAVRLWGYFADPDTKSIRKLFVDNIVSEFVDVINPYSYHEVLGKSGSIIVLQNKAASLLFKTGIAGCFKSDIKTQFCKKQL